MGGREREKGVECFFWVWGRGEGGVCSVSGGVSSEMVIVQPSPGCSVVRMLAYRLKGCGFDS